MVTHPFDIMKQHDDQQAQQRAAQQYGTPIGRGTFAQPAHDWGASSGISSTLTDSPLAGMVSNSVVIPPHEQSIVQSASGILARGTMPKGLGNDDGK